MYILGADIGNIFTKSSKGIVFPSRIISGHKELNKEDTKVEFNGKKYTVGVGNLYLGADRINSTLYDLCLLTCIAKSYPKDKNITVNTVVGLPPKDYESIVKNNLKERLNQLETQKIIINGSEISITINKAEVFCESAIVFNNPNEYRNKKTLVIDIGGGTADISQFKGLELIKYTTTKLGMLTLDESMRQVFNPKHTANYDIDAMEELIGKDTETIRGDKVDITYLNDIIEDHVTQICNVINQSFDTDSTDINIIGGGADKLISFFKKQYKNAQILKDNQLVNAKTYAAVGEMLWSAQK